MTLQIFQKIIYISSNENSVSLSSCHLDRAASTMLNVIANAINATPSAYMYCTAFVSGKSEVVILYKVGARILAKPFSSVTTSFSVTGCQSK